MGGVTGSLILTVFYFLTSDLPRLLLEVEAGIKKSTVKRRARLPPFTACMPGAWDALPRACRPLISVVRRSMGCASLPTSLARQHPKVQKPDIGCLNGRWGQALITN